MAYQSLEQLKQLQRPAPTLKQLQRLIMSREMQQALHLLQLPVLEMQPLIERELEQNPVLEHAAENDEESFEIEQLKEDAEEPEEEPPTENQLVFDERDFEALHHLDEEFRDHFLESGSSSDQEKFRTFLESSITADPTPFEYLMRQAQEAFSDKKDLKAAEMLIGSLDESGFLSSSLEELAALQGHCKKYLEKILAQIQTFDPCGIGARDLQETLLIQLRAMHKEHTLAYAVIDQHFTDLTHNRIPAIIKGLSCSAKELEETIADHLSKLTLHPGMQIARKPTRYIVPDLILRQEENALIPAVSDESMPRLRLNARYMRLLEDNTLSVEAKDFIRQKAASARWLLKNILQRNDTLEKIAGSLAARQRDFFLNPEGKLVPLTMKALAEELQIHESTIARAVANKYIDTPRGLFPLRFFFTSALKTEGGEDISSKTAKGILTRIIGQEDKKHPLSDEAISALMRSQGVPCARRTVSKYRRALNIGSARQRKKF